MEASLGRVRLVCQRRQPIVRQGLAELINRQKNLVVCGETGSGREAPEPARRLEPDLAVIDVSLQEASGIQLLKTLKLQRPQLPLLVLSMHEEGLTHSRWENPRLRHQKMSYPKTGRCPIPRDKDLCLCFALSMTMAQRVRGSTSQTCSTFWKRSAFLRLSPRGQAVN